MRRLIRWWLHSVNPQVASLVATIGVVGLCLCLLLLLLVGWMFQEVLEKESFSWDTSILLWLHHNANPLLDQMMLSLTALGNPTTAIAVTVLSLALLLWQRQRLEAQMFALACLGAVILNKGLKLVFSKPRPQLWVQLITETSFSFPSGHALGTLVLYGFLAYLLVLKYPNFKIPIYGVAGTIIFLIGLSRLYLGVHWPSDIVAGYAIGFLWLMICITMLRIQAGRA